ncbi:hypothetical protein DL93DRAFT_2165484 [Clavulina sp. PMI_390]|nr:hypothetical protein DL93DRAFT_2165484 [Clavulina sp. PMI_390]
MSDRARKNPFHSARDQVVGRGPHQVPPAWAHNHHQQQRRGQAAQPPRVFRAYETRIPVDALPPGTRKVRLEDAEGSTILIENLPLDTEPQDLLELFSSKVGPVESHDILYNNRGVSKGIALLTFIHREHAFMARKMFHGQLIDSNRPMRIRVVMDINNIPEPTAPISNIQPIAGPSNAPMAVPIQARVEGAKNPNFRQKPAASPNGDLASRVAPLPLHARIGPAVTSNKSSRKVSGTPSTPRITGTSSAEAPSADRPGRKRPKKGPRRLAKGTLAQATKNAASGKWTLKKKTATELDAEMDEWRSAENTAVPAPAT